MQHSSLALLFVFTLGACDAQSDSPAKSPQAEPAAPQASVPAAKLVPAAVDPAQIHIAHADALQWLEAQQQKDGSWNSAEEGGRNAIGLTGLALLALQSDGSTMHTGAHAASVARGVQWLMTRQNADEGLIGERVGHSFGYDHAIATQALCIALRGAPGDELKKAAQNAVNFIARMRNPYGAWRYDYPPSGDNDTSVTGWMVEAIASAKAAGLKVDQDAFAGAKQWIDDVTDPKTARVGYDAIGSASSRVTGLNDQFPTDRHEAMTASGMVTRMNAGQTADAAPILSRHADLLQLHLPEWDDGGQLVDEYYWYFGSLAMKRLGGKSWTAWSSSARTALLAGQHQSGDTKGSWNPLGPWAYSGGRIFSTSLNALSLSTML